MGLTVQRGGGASLSGYVPTTRTISVSGLGLSGGGDLSADRTITLTSDATASANAHIVATDASGILRPLQAFVGSTDPTTPADQALNVNFSNGTNGAVRSGINVVATLNGAGAHIRGVTVTATVPGGGVGNGLIGLNFTVSRSDSSGFDTAGLQGTASVSGTAGYSGAIRAATFTAAYAGTAGAAASVNGINVTARNQSTGTATLVRGVQISVSNLNAAGTLVEGRGLDLSGWSNNGTWTTSYGIYADTSIDKGATRYFIYSLSTSPSLLTGTLQAARLGLGVAPDANKIILARSAGQAQLELQYDASNVATFTVGVSGTLTIQSAAFVLNSNGGIGKLGDTGNNYWIQVQPSTGLVSMGDLGTGANSTQLVVDDLNQKVTVNRALYIGSSAQLQINASGLVTKQNNVATEGMGVSTIINSVALTGQTADIGSTNIASGNIAGVYRISYYIAATSVNALAGAVTVAFAFTDGAGATTVSSTPLPLTALGRTSGHFVVQLASGSIAYSTTHTGIFSTSQYALYIIAERLS